jgi:nucleoside transporter
MKSYRFQLSVMMFLEFFIWGTWLPRIREYLGGLHFTGDQQSWIMNAFPLASFTAMFFFTQFADRNFAAEKFLAFSHLVGGLAILGLFFVEGFWPFFLLMLLHCLFYVPTISITNSIAFANLRDRQNEFGPVRLWGTIGWIAASLPFLFILVDWNKVIQSEPETVMDWVVGILSTGKTGAAELEGIRYTYLAAGIASLLLAAFSLVLPHTPPRPAAFMERVEKFAWLEAMRLLRVPFVLVLFIVTFFDAAVHSCYFYWTGTYFTQIGIASHWVMPVMTLGQFAEIGTMAILGYCLKQLGWRYTMVIGILGHTLRFAVFAWLPYPAPAILVNLLHGICYAFFFATVYIFVDEFFPKDARSSAQGLFNFLILGLGPFVGNFAWGYLGEEFTTTGGKIDFQRLFLVPSAVSLGAAVLLFLFFRPPERAQTGLEAAGLSSEGDEAYPGKAAWDKRTPSDAIKDPRRVNPAEGITDLRRPEPE